MRLDVVNGVNARWSVIQSITSVEAFQKELGLSQDQAIELCRQAMVDPQPILLLNNPVYQSLQEEREKLQPFHPDATEETRARYIDLRTEMIAMEQQMHIDILNATYTPDQLKKINEFMISNMSETEFVFPGMFEVLGLSEEQKEQLAKIQKEMEPEIEQQIDGRVAYYSKEHKTTNEARDEQLRRTTDPEERERIFNDRDSYRKILAELKPDRDKMMKSNKELADKLKIKMFDVLTDEQWKRMCQLIDNPPEYAKKMITQQRKDRAELDSLNGKPEVYTPGPNSWQPGQPIPEEYRQQRNTGGRFPRTETKE
jgi:hypothetical protein